MSEPKYIGQSLYIAIKITNDDDTPVNLDELDNFAIILKLADKIYLFASKQGEEGEVVFTKITENYYSCKVADTITAKFIEGVYDMEVGVVSPDSDINTFKLISRVPKAITFVNNLMYKKLA